MFFNEVLALLRALEDVKVLMGIWCAETKACGVNLVSALMFVPDFRRYAVKPSRLGSCMLHAGIYMQY